MFISFNHHVEALEESCSKRMKLRPIASVTKHGKTKEKIHSRGRSAPVHGFLGRK